MPRKSLKQPAQHETGHKLDQPRKVCDPTQTLFKTQTSQAHVKPQRRSFQSKTVRIPEGLVFEVKANRSVNTTKYEEVSGKSYEAISEASARRLVSESRARVAAF